jgi:hypothetical protein
VKLLRYQAASLLTVLAIRKNRRQVALKVQKSASHYTEAAMDEIEFLRKVLIDSAQRYLDYCWQNHLLESGVELWVEVRYFENFFSGEWYSRQWFGSRGPPIGPF